MGMSVRWELAFRTHDPMAGDRWSAGQGSNPARLWYERDLRAYSVRAGRDGGHQLYGRRCSVPDRVPPRKGSWSRSADSFQRVSLPAAASPKIPSSDLVLIHQTHAGGVWQLLHCKGAEALEVGCGSKAAPAQSSRDRSATSGLLSIPGTMSIDSRMDAKCQYLTETPQGGLDSG
jgi:hypothetical protein